VADNDAPAPEHEAAPKSGGWNKKYLHVPLWGWAVGAGGLAAIAWFAWKRHEAAAAGKAGTTVASSSTEAGLTTAQLNALDQALADMQGYTSTSLNGSGSGTGTGTATTTATTTKTTSTSTKTGTTTSTSGKTTSTTTSTGWKFPAPTGLQAYDKAKNGYRLSWNAVKGPNGQIPSSYTVATYDASGTLVDQFDTQQGNTNTAEYGRGGGGLPKGTYHSNVWANGGPVAPPHATVTVTLSS
jgi:hypothetical protein